MRAPRYYYYDPDRCTFVPAPLRRTHPLAQGALVLTAAVFLAGAMLLALDFADVTPQESALRIENEALKRDFYRTRAEAEICNAQLYELRRRARPQGTDASMPPPRSYQRAGVGLFAPPGVDAATRSAEALLTESSRKLFDVEQLIYTQNVGYRELLELVEQRDTRMAQLPAILPTDGPIVSNYGMRRHPILHTLAMHYGIDILVPPGTPVVATGDGVVAAVGFNITYGKHVKIGHPSVGYTTLYAHLSDIPANVQPGHAVKRRDRIGLSGATGRVTGPHLHYEVHDSRGRTIHPLSFILPHMKPDEYTKMLRIDAGSPHGYD